MSEHWNAGVFLAKARELNRRLRSWHIESFLFPKEFASLRESRNWKRLTFRDIVTNEIANSIFRPGKGQQFFPHEGGTPDEEGCVGEVYENPDEDTDRSLAMWLMGDFQRHLDAAPQLPALDYLKESFGHLLDLPAWTVREPAAGELPPQEYGLDEQSQMRCYMVTGRPVPCEFLDALTDAAVQLLARAPDGWRTAPTEKINIPCDQDGKRQGKSRTTKKRLEESQKDSAKLKLQIYTFIQEQHAAGKKPSQILTDLKASKDRKDQIAKAGLKPDKALVKRALALPGQRERDQKQRDQKRKKQDSPPE